MEVVFRGACTLAEVEEKAARTTLRRGPNVRSINNHHMNKTAYYKFDLYIHKWYLGDRSNLQESGPR
jgi:hypothetical protein